MPKTFESFSAFYPTYLKMHRHPANRRLHVLGSLLGLGAIGFALGAGWWLALLAAPVLANACDWFGHLYFEKNRPGVLGYPIYGMLGGWRMTWDVLAGQLPSVDAT
jgi:hypothetical protein